MMTDVVCSVSMSQILLGNVQKLFGLEFFLHNLLMYSTFFSQLPPLMSPLLFSPLSLNILEFI